MSVESLIAMLRDHENLASAAWVPARLHEFGSVLTARSLAMEGRQRRHSLLGLSCARRPQDHPERVTLEHDGGESRLGRGCCQVPGTTRGDRSRLRPARDLVAGERRQLFRGRLRRQHPHTRRTRTGAHTSSADLSRRKTAARRERPGTFAEECGSRRAFGDERDRQPGRQGTHPQRAGRLSRTATVAAQSTQPGSGPPTAATRAHAAAACSAQGRLNPIVTASGLPGGA